MPPFCFLSLASHALTLVCLLVTVPACTSTNFEVSGSMRIKLDYGCSHHVIA